MFQYTPEFLEFWKVYPRRVAKIAAYKAFNRVLKMGVEHELIIAGARKYADYVAGKDEQYICHPTTFLNQGRWEDEYRNAGTQTDRKPTYADSLKNAVGAALSAQRDKETFGR